MDRVKRPDYWEWREIRLEVLDRDKTCVYCGAEVAAKTGTIDHIIPIARGGGYGLDNLVASCKTCNESKGDKLPTSFIFHDYIKVLLRSPRNGA